MSKETMFIQAFIMLFVFMVGNGHAQTGCFDIASNSKTYLANSKTSFDRPIELMINYPSKLLPTQKYEFCEQIMSYGFHDLGNIACFDVDVEKLTDQQKTRLEYFQAIVLASNLEFKAAFENVNKALKQLDNHTKQSSNDVEPKKLLRESIRPLGYKLWLSYLLFPNEDHKTSGERLKITLEKLNYDACYLTTSLYFKASTLALYEKDVSNDIKSLVKLYDDLSCHEKLEDIALFRSFVYEHTDSSTDEKIKNIENLLNQSKDSCDLGTIHSLATSLFKFSFHEDRLAADDYLILSKEMSGYSGSLHNQSITSWNTAITDAVDGESDKAIETFSSVCDVAKEKTSVDNKTLFGNFSFLSESDQSKVEELYLQSSCSVK